MKDALQIVDGNGYIFFCASRIFLLLIGLNHFLTKANLNVFILFYIDFLMLLISFSFEILCIILGLAHIPPLTGKLSSHGLPTAFSPFCELRLLVYS